MHQGGPMGPQAPQQGPPRYPNQNQWNGPPRSNGPPRQGPPPGPPQHRPMVNLISFIQIRLVVRELKTSKFLVSRTTRNASTWSTT